MGLDLIFTTLTFLQNLALDLVHFIYLFIFFICVMNSDSLIERYSSQVKKIIHSIIIASINQSRYFDWANESSQDFSYLNN